MSNELQTILPQFLQAAVPNNERHLSMDIENFVAGNKIGELHLHMPHSDVPPPLLTPEIEERDFNRQYYNLFVWGDELDIEHISPFTIDTDRIMMPTYTNSDIIDMFSISKLKDEQTAEIVCSFPCLFANENKHYGKAEPDQAVGFGYIERIKVREEKGVMVFPKVLYRLPQQPINEAYFELDFVMNKSSYPELNRSHWSIKQVDLIAELQEMGFPL